MFLRIFAGAAVIAIVIFGVALMGWAHGESYWQAVKAVAMTLGSLVAFFGGGVIVVALAVFAITGRV